MAVRKPRPEDRVEPREDRRQRATQVVIASGINALIGIWLIVSPFVLSYDADAAASGWNAIIVGAAVLVLAGIRVFGAFEAAWLSWLNVLIGAWLIASAWVFGDAEFAEVLWNDVIVGAAIVVFGLWSALASPSDSTD